MEISYKRNYFFENQLNKFGIGLGEFTSFFKKIASSCGHNTVEAELLLNLLIISWSRGPFDKEYLCRIMATMNNLADVKCEITRLLRLPCGTTYTLNTYSVNGETVYYFSINSVENYLFWDLLLPGVYLVSDSKETSSIIDFSYQKHLTLFLDYPALSDAVGSLRHISLYSPLSKKFLPAEESYLEFLTVERSLRGAQQGGACLSPAMLRQSAIYYQYFISGFQDPGKLIKELFPRIKGAEELSDCTKAEILLAMGGQKVSRFTLPKTTADNLFELWEAIGPCCCASSFLAGTKDEGLGSFSNQPFGFVSYTSEKNILSEKLLFIYISIAPFKASDCARLDAEDEAGSLLGIPECCIEAYKNSRPISGHLNPFEIGGPMGNKLDLPWQLNFYSMYHGAGLLWHFPCSKTCSRTVEVVNNRFDFLSEIDVDFAIYLKSRHFLPSFFLGQQYLGNSKGEGMNVTTTINWK